MSPGTLGVVTSFSQQVADVDPEAGMSQEGFGMVWGKPVTSPQQAHFCFN